MVGTGASDAQHDDDDEEEEEEGKGCSSFGRNSGIEAQARDFVVLDNLRTF